MGAWFIADAAFARHSKTGAALLLATLQTEGAPAGAASVWSG